MSRFAISLAAILLFAESDSMNSSAYAADRVVELVPGTHRRELFEAPVARIAGSSSAVSSFELLNDREVLIDAKSVGRASLTIWFVDGRVETLAVHIVRDLSVLSRALADISTTIVIEGAPDRDAVVMRGSVPDRARALAAESIARRYLGAREIAVPPLVSRADEGPAAVKVESEGAPVAAREVEVINLLTVDELPLCAEDRVGAALRSIGATSVVVTRLSRSDLANDAVDSLLLSGEVPDQVTLVRALHLASSAFLDQELRENDIRAVADESGALREAISNAASSGGFTGASLDLFGSSGSSGGAGRLENRVDANLGRAKLIAVKGGRILSFLEVKDMPQVRVDVRLFEIDRSDLTSYSPRFLLQGSDEASLGKDASALVGFIESGFRQQTSLAFHRFSIDGVFDWLESRGVGRSLARPSLTVLSGERAIFQVGGEVPIPESFVPTIGSVTPGTAVTPGVFSSVEFREFGVQLEVRPLVSDDGAITLDVLARLARPDAALTTLIRESTGTDPLTTSFATRSVRTSARLGDGETMLVAGLLDEKSEDSASFTPVLEQVPLLGWLFKRYSMSDEDLEVVIALHPVVLREKPPALDLWQFPPLHEALARTRGIPRNRELPPEPRHSEP